MVDLSYSFGNTCFSCDGVQSHLMFHQLFNKLRLRNSDHIRVTSWKSEAISTEKIRPPDTMVQRKILQYIIKKGKITLNFRDYISKQLRYIQFMN